MPMKSTILLVLSLLCITASYAGGYRIALQGQKQLAMGHTGVAVINASELVFFNPSGLTFLNEKFTVSVGANLVFPILVFKTKTMVGTPRIKMVYPPLLMYTPPIRSTNGSV